MSWPEGRVMGAGPSFVKFGRKVFYRASRIPAWLDSLERTKRPGSASGLFERPSRIS